MSDLINIISQPFMQRAILGGLIVAVICAATGVFVTLRKESFISEAIAHASLAGVAVAFLISAQPLWMAVLVGILTSLGITFVQKRSNISADAVIGIFLTVVFAIGILILSLLPGYRPELTSYLFGSILSITQSDIWISLLFTVPVLATIAFLYRQMLFSAFDPEYAKIRGIRVDCFDYLTRILAAVVVVLSIKLVGIVLVTAMIVIPASTARLFCQRFSQMIPMSLVLAIFSVIIGLFVSYFMNVPSGSTVVLTAGAIFAIVGIISVVYQHLWVEKK
jgi:zinc transport system permease protein